MKKALISIQIHSTFSSYCSHDIFLEKIIEINDLENTKKQLMIIDKLSYRGSEVENNNPDYDIGYYFEDNTYTIIGCPEATEEQMREKSITYLELGFYFNTTFLPYAIKEETNQPKNKKEKILELIELINEELLEGWSYKCYNLEDLIELVYKENEIDNFPNKLYNNRITENCEELLRQFEDGIEGLREVENLVTNVYKAYNMKNPVL